MSTKPDNLYMSRRQETGDSNSLEIASELKTLIIAIRTKANILEDQKVNLEL